MNEILSNIKRPVRGDENRVYTKDVVSDPMGVSDRKLANVVQWTTDDNRRFIPSPKTCNLIPSGMYEIHQAPSIGVYFENIFIKTEGLLKFPETNSEKIVNEIQLFWKEKDLFRKFGLIHKRGVLFWGPPGSGKSCTVQLIIKDVVERGGVAIKFVSPTLFLEGMRLFRSIQPETPVVVLMEDIDEIVSFYNESEVLNVLDGVEVLDKTVFLATTNYPEVLGPRIVNRPSRFDKRIKIGHPNQESRMMYFEHLFQNHQEFIDKYNLKVWVSDTNGMSIAHLKELFVAVVILKDPYEEVIETLKSMKENISSEFNDGKLGFLSNN